MTKTRPTAKATAGLRPRSRGVDDTPVLQFDTAAAWEQWLAKHHVSSDGVWLRFRRKAPGSESLSYAQALDVALCYGWIDGQNKREDEAWWRQRFTPRRARSIWSKINREKVAALIAAGRMRPAGLAAIERAKQDGRWEAAYDAASKAAVPPDLQAALDAAPRAKAFFQTLDARNRYAILFRTHGAKKAETRARRIATFVAMLKRRETIYPSGD
jgi:uncharacterized protein YdeI (YjbR/CyaY-like superfamily)